MPLRPLMRFEVFKRDDFTCRYCGRKTPEAVLEVDHVIPVSAGGTDDIENLITACSACNIGKGARLLTQLPNVPDIHERAVELAEQERQLAEYNHWRAKQRERENAAIQSLADLWHAAWGGSVDQHRWSDASVRRFLRRLAPDDVLDVIEYVLDAARDPAGRIEYEDHAWRIVCALCWRKIKDRAPTLDPSTPDPPRLLSPPQQRPDYDGED